MKEQNVKDNKLDFRMIGTLILAISMFLGYGWYLFVRLPQKNEEKRLESYATLGIVTPDINDMVTKTMQWYQINKPTETLLPTMTETPMPTMTETPEITIYPTITMTPVADYEMIAKISYYWPPLCGTDADPNCINGDHNIYTTAALDDWVARAVAGEKICACPDSFVFGTRFLIFDDVWTCWDRGGAIVWYDHSKIWLDLLSPDMPYPIEWGTEMKVYVMPPVYQD